MQKRLLSSAEKAYRNRDQLIADLRRIAKKIQQEKKVKEIARGDYGLYSDADILIILEKSDKKRYFDRIPDLIGYFVNSLIQVDIFPYTVKEIETMRITNQFIKRALTEGIKL